MAPHLYPAVFAEIPSPASGAKLSFVNIYVILVINYKLLYKVVRNYLCRTTEVIDLSSSDLCL